MSNTKRPYKRTPYLLPEHRGDKKAHFSRAYYPTPQLHNSPLPGWVWGSVLRWRLAFPQAGFSPAGECEFISAHLCTLWFNL
ncbi:MAG: hypothetical protein C5S48_09995 [Candidatus Methanogaster sp.]|nr:MAG: hypothetical protein C5S48_09995 [ANME-2 cluster archaeon]